MTDRQLLMKDFLSAMYAFSPADARVMACQFRGDPNDDIRGKWRSYPITQVTQLDDGANVYFAVSAMKKNLKGEFRRRKENFAAGLLLMIDDIGSGPGSKFPMTILDAAQPTALIETSPGNHQAVYMFDGPETDPTKMEALINGFIARQFLGRDTGMAGINRVFRPPYGINGKAKYGGWQVRCVSFSPSARYSINALAAAFGISLEEQMYSRVPHNATLGKAETIRAFVGVRSALRTARMLKREEPDMSGWQDVVCPWTDGHTDQADNGAAIREPAEENGWVGAFRCHHGTCEGKGWREITDWLADNQEEILERINAAPRTFASFRRKA
jgi:hypothetical protein